MKAEIYDKSKRASIYNSIFIYKIVSLCILVLMTAVLIFLYYRDKKQYVVEENIPTPPVFYVMAVCLVLFVISIILDFYILKRTEAIGIRLNKMAFLDKLTGLPNRYSCDLLFDIFDKTEKVSKAGFILMKINNLSNVNIDKGHLDGNWLISEFCSILEDVGESYGYIGRNGGNEFIMLMEDCDSTDSDMFLLDLTKRIQGYNEMNVGNSIEIAYSRVLNIEENEISMSSLISKGYTKLRQEAQILS